MNLVEFEINKSKYKIQCPQDEKEKILTLAKEVDKKVKNLAKQLKNNDEKTLLAISCLIMQDEIRSLKISGSEDSEEKIDEDLEKILTKIDSLAKKIESY